MVPELMMIQLYTSDVKLWPFRWRVVDGRAASAAPVGPKIPRGSSPDACSQPAVPFRTVQQVTLL